MTYTVKGKLIAGGRDFSITWNDGKLEGDLLASKLLEAVADAAQGRPIGPVTGPFTLLDHLKDPISSVVLMQELFAGGVTEYTGELPELPEIPDGAKA